ncbi:hypothetical protein SARC_02758 [Sphaeroforma arctica JP610]|uniref:Uncharacterized protein n=1 Tax=Sphaeroforma arctica JP610 TaxID=667725 RepID=A0A0L0G9V0_9EUKA|nr:hypothetical protein SARC_02758 [Sphaeroforma arctica JP610]KNC85033.1 hypothetical protein SARC_02758 [Sphaeroforma arctica JP610]|eukprot:XP_014158935.1 hypothetical protein SARC_02758 [Sphaeroforma arctica JP610]
MGMTANANGVNNSPTGEPTPGSSSSLHTPNGVTIQASAIRLEIDKSTCQGNCFLVSWFISKLEATTPVAIGSLHRMRVGIYDQQLERRMPLVDTELRERCDQATNECGGDEGCEETQISQYISELEIMRSRLVDKANETVVFKLLTTSEFLKLSIDSSFKMENCDIIQFTTQCRDMFLAKSMQLCQYPALVRYVLDSADATEKTKVVLNEILDSKTQITKHYTDPEQFNRVIIDLRHISVDYLLEKILNDMENKAFNVEVLTERMHRTMQVLEERYRHTDKENP